MTTSVEGIFTGFKYYMSTLASEICFTLEEIPAIVDVEMAVTKLVWVLIIDKCRKSHLTNDVILHPDLTMPPQHPADPITLRH